MLVFGRLLIFLLTTFKAIAFFDPRLGESVRFATELYKAVRDERPNENIVVSPFSVKTALGLFLTAADGITATEILDTLRLHQRSRWGIVSHFAQLTEHFQRQSAVIANKLFLNVSYTPKAIFNEFVRATFRAEAEQIDFSNTLEATDAISSWIKNQTASRTDEISGLYSLDKNTRLVLANTAFFQGVWQTPTGKHRTPAGRWPSFDVIHFETKVRTVHISDLQAKLMMVPFNKSQLSLCIISPYSSTDFESLETKLLNFDFSRLGADVVREEEVELYLPKFEIVSPINLSEILQRLGIKTIFSEGANLNKLLKYGGPLSLDQFLHTAHIKIDGDDTETTSADFSEKKPVIWISSPFYFAIGSPHEVLFIGSVGKTSMVDDTE